MNAWMTFSRSGDVSMCFILKTERSWFKQDWTNLLTWKSTLSQNVHLGFLCSGSTQNPPVLSWTFNENPLIFWNGEPFYILKIPFRIHNGGTKCCLFWQISFEGSTKTLTVQIWRKQILSPIYCMLWSPVILTIYVSVNFGTMIDKDRRMWGYINRTGQAVWFWGTGQKWW